MSLPPQEEEEEFEEEEGLGHQLGRRLLRAQLQQARAHSHAVAKAIRGVDNEEEEEEYEDEEDEEEDEEEDDEEDEEEEAHDGAATATAATTGGGAQAGHGSGGGGVASYEELAERKRREFRKRQEAHQRVQRELYGDAPLQSAATTPGYARAAPTELQELEAIAEDMGVLGTSKVLLQSTPRPCLEPLVLLRASYTLG